MKGMVGRIPQGMAARKAQPALEVIEVLEANSGTGTVTAPRTCVAMVYAWGGGAAGGGNGGNDGGGGAAAGYIAVRLARGQSIAYSVGAGGAGPNALGVAGGDTTITLPDGRVCVAQGGQLAGVKALARGFDLNRYGGGGGVAPAGEAGQDGQFGGLGGATAGDSGGGGGAGGFSDKDIGLVGGAGTIGEQSATPANAPGGGAGAYNAVGLYGANGAAGRVLIYMVRALL